MKKNNILNKSLYVLKNEGVFSLLKKSKRYIFNHKKNNNVKFAKEMKDVLFVNGCSLPHPERYRVDHQIEQLCSNGITADKIYYEDLTIDKEKYYNCFVIFRCPITPEVEKLIKKAKENNKSVIFDIDDLVFDKKYTDSIEYLKTMSKPELDTYYDGINRMNETLKLCDYATTTTNEIATELKKYCNEVFVNKNVVSEEMMSLSKFAIKNINKDTDKLYIGYLSGSITHNEDFKMIIKPLIKVLKEKENVYLKIYGELELPDELKEFSNRIIKEKFVEWRKLPSIIRTLDINLAPLKDTKFNRAKSENKWTEAACVQTVTLASNVGAFKTINNNVDGVLCNNNDKDWYENLIKLIEDNSLREKIALNAYIRVSKEYLTTYSGFDYFNFIKSKLKNTISFVLPSTNISGGVNVVLKHCSVLKSHKYNVCIINDDSNENNVFYDGIEINVVSNVTTQINCSFNKMIATLWSTLYYCLSYFKVNKISYLVQNFETDFMENNNKERFRANSTYSIDNIEYLTISKWCKDWLKNDYNQNAKYIKNGIDLSKFKYSKRKFDGKIKILIEGNCDDYYKNVDESFKITNQLDKNKFEIYYLSYQGKPKEWYYVDKFYHKIPFNKVNEIYSSCDILLKSSILESFSYPPLEMMATGGIAIVSPNAGNVEYLKDKENCLFYKPGDINDALRVINDIVSNEQLRNKLIKNGLETAKQRSWNMIEKDIIDLYKD